MPVGSVEKVQSYLDAVPGPFQAALRKVRAQIRGAAPNAEEGFGYGLPGFYQEGPLLYYGAAKSHCAIYGTIPAQFDAELAGFERSKGTIKFTPNKPVPGALLKRIVKAKLAENRERVAAKARAIGSTTKGSGAKGSEAKGSKPKGSKRRLLASPPTPRKATQKP
jgi:uncharacterized protein YdhG (YjbR/CyaY superfamily)